MLIRNVVRNVIQLPAAVGGGYFDNIGIGRIMECLQYQEDATIMSDTIINLLITYSDKQNNPL